jgi:hypothetical protein
MDKKTFDQIIREKVPHVTVSGAEDAWQSFEDKQNKADAGNKAFDHTIRQKVRSHTPRFQDSHWNAMEERMEIIFNRLSTVAASKGMECMAVILIASTYFTWSYPTTQSASHQYAAMQPAQDCTPVSNATKNEANAKKSYTYFLQDEARPARDSATSVQVKSPSSSSASIQNPPVYQNTARLIVPLESLVFTIPNLSPQRQFAKVHHNIAPILLPASPSLAVQEAARLPLPDIPALSSEIAFSMGTKPLEPARQLPTEHYLLGYVSADVNMINTPFDKLYSVSSYKKEAVNHSIGLGFSGRKDNVEWETALEYVKREYSPVRITETFGQGSDYYFETSLKKIKFNIAGIPLHIKYHFLSAPTWSMYLVSSVQLNLVMDASYEIEESLIHGRPQPGRYTPEVPRLEDKPFIKGILHGEAFSDNYYISAGLGLGVQKKIFANTFVFLQPSYVRHLLSKDIGIGPNKDKIHGTSLQLGIKTVLP